MEVVLPTSLGVAEEVICADDKAVAVELGKVGDAIVGGVEMSVGVVHHHELVVAQLVVRRVFGNIKDLVGCWVGGYGPSKLDTGMGRELRMLARIRVVFVTFDGSITSDRRSQFRLEQGRACIVAPWLMG